jgi:hypothetical protein
MSKDEISMDAESKVKEFLQSYGLNPEKYSKEELRAGKTPDFKVYKDNELSFYCEVKNPEKDTWLDEKLNNSESGELVGGLRKDPTFNRLTAHIHKAKKQFDAVNEDESMPNVLAFYNEDKQSGFLDLLAVTTGNFFAEDGAFFPIYKNYSEGRVKKDIENIHLFIWIDAHKPHRFLFNTINSKYQSKLCSIFGYDSEKLELVYS